jgi:subtilisin family serine protease
MLLRTLKFALILMALEPLHAQDPFGAAVPGRYLVAYSNGTIPPDAATRAQALGGQLVHRNERFGIAVVSNVSANALTELRLQPGVQSVLADRVVSAHAIQTRAIPADIASPAAVEVASPAMTVGTLSPQRAPLPVTLSDGLYSSTRGWAVRQVGGYGAGIPGGPAHGPWDTTQGKGVRIAILDSGIDANHPDLAPNLALNITEVEQSPTTGLPSVCDDGSPQDQQGHGTWTASLAAAALGPATGLVAGVAPQATLLNIKVLQRMPAIAGDPTTCANGEASGLLSWVIQGIEDAVAERADIISMSLGTLVDLETGEGAGLQALFDQVTNTAAQAGVLLIASAGNDGFDLSNLRYVELPAQSRGVLSIVASTNPACAENLAAGAVCAPGPITLPYYSNTGAPLAALSAPGGSYPAGADADPANTNTWTVASGWITAACSAGKPDTLVGPPADGAHSMGCFGLGHAQYVQAMGTSASAPLAAGVAALVMAAHPNWSAAAVLAALRSGATTLPGMAAPQIGAAGAIAQ